MIWIVQSLVWCIPILLSDTGKTVATYNKLLILWLVLVFSLQQFAKKNTSIINLLMITGLLMHNARGNATVIRKQLVKDIITACKRKKWPWGTIYLERASLTRHCGDFFFSMCMLEWTHAFMLVIFGMPLNSDWEWIQIIFYNHFKITSHNLTSLILK